MVQGVQWPLQTELSQSITESHWLRNDAGGATAAVVRCMASSHRGIAKEACWAAANMAGTPGRAGSDAIIAAGGSAVAIEVIKDAGFDIRKEAAFLVANICAGAEKHIPFDRSFVTFDFSIFWWDSHSQGSCSTRSQPLCRC